MEFMLAYIFIPGSKLMFFGPFSLKPQPELNAIAIHSTSVTGLHCHLPDALPCCPSSIQNMNFHAVERMPRTKGDVNYKNDLLINIILEILPTGEYGLQAVSCAYHEQTKEELPRNTDNLKGH
jgi:hypothetical protein